MSDGVPARRRKPRPETGDADDERLRELQEIGDLLRRRMLRDLRRREARAGSRLWHLLEDPPVWLTWAGVGGFLVLTLSGGIALGSILAALVRGRAAFMPVEVAGWPDILFLAGLVLIGASLVLLAMAGFWMRRR
ncbi:hypothetical protein [Roseomonas mucosa]|uniref:hypothetical protein n=1 Tax=Roseomonas mucosa TaxID=207340 RepID=UPI0028CD20F1|nr:hypothetical protein [Roseomonas mucosa]MDT8351881.1 hypothetical protein [Roseomonas mucosa]